MTNQIPINTITEVEQKPKAKVPEPRSMKEGSKKEVQKVLFVGDSIAGNVHLPTIEAAVNADVKLVKAYSSAYENTDTAAHRAPKFPHKNFEDVIIVIIIIIII